MRRTGRVARSLGALLVALSIGCGLVGPWVPDAAARAASPAAPVTAPRRVVIVSIPRLGWDDVVPADMPTLVGLADQGAVGALSVRAIGRHTTPAEGYATLGAGNRVQAAESDAVVLGRSQATVGKETAAEILRDEGRTPSGRAVIPGIGAIERANRHTHQGAEVGALGTALGHRGWTTEVVLDGGGWMPSGSPAGLSLVDGQGSIDTARVLGTVLNYPGVFSTNLDQIARTVRKLPSRKLVSLVELADVARADDEHLGRDLRRTAAREADTALAAVVDELDLRQDLLIVLAPVGPSSQDQPTPIVVSGPGIDRGLLRSATTRRKGYVTLTDVAPAVLSWIGAPVPAAMDGTPIEVAADRRSGFDRVAAVRTAIAETRFVDRSAGKLMSTLAIWFGAWSVLLLAVLLVPLGPVRRPAVPFLKWVGLLMLAMPGMSFALAAASTRGWGQPAWFAVLIVASGLAASAATLLARPFHRDPWFGPVLLAGATWLLLAADMVTGARLQFDSALGNSPTVAGRFQGIGNVGFALLASSAVVLACVAVAGFRRTSAPRWVGPIVAAAILATTVVLDGAPAFGSDVGGVLALVPASFVCLWLLGGRRFSWRPILGAAVAALVVIGGFGAWDLSRPAADRSHLGRFLAGDDSSRETVIRKAASAGISVYHSSLIWILISVVGLGAAAWLWRRPVVRARFAAGTTARTLAVSATVVAVLGGALNDSGVAVPAMMAYVFVPIAVCVLVRPGRGAVRERPIVDAPPEAPAASDDRPLVVTARGPG